MLMNKKQDERCNLYCTLSLCLVSLSHCVLEAIKSLLIISTVFMIRPEITGQKHSCGDKHFCMSSVGEYSGVRPSDLCVT